MSRHHLAILVLFTLSWLAPVPARYVDDVDSQVLYSRHAHTRRVLACRLSAARCAHWYDSVLGFCARSSFVRRSLEESNRFHGGSLHVTGDPAASVSFVFNGSRPLLPVRCRLTKTLPGSAVRLVGSTFPRGAMALVSVDGNTPQRIDFTSSSGSRVDGVSVYAHSGLNPTTTHTLHVSYDPTSFVSRQDERRYMAIDAFVVECASFDLRCAAAHTAT